MAERKSQQKYYPPDYDPSVGSINKWRGHHPLGDRARKIKQGIIIIRFELPYHIWCSGCGRHIARGVRFNAEKKVIGNYFSTKVFSFSFTCPSCPMKIIMKTDPEHQDYEVIEGAERKNEDRTEEDLHESGMVQMISEEERKQRAQDPFFQLEKLADDEKSGKEKAKQVQSIVESQRMLGDDYSLLCAMRKKVRDERKESQKLKTEARQLGLSGISRLLPLNNDDINEAQRVAPRIADVREKRKGEQADEIDKKRRLQVRFGSIFETPPLKAKK